MFLCEYRVKQSAPKETWGFFVINNTDYFQACSGGWGKGTIPYGEYTLSNLRKLPDTDQYKAFKRDGFPWGADLTPKFPTDRSALMVHADGNLPGTLGCVGIIKDDIKCFTLLSKLLVLCEGKVKFLAH